MCAAWGHAEQTIVARFFALILNTATKDEAQSDVNLQFCQSFLFFAASWKTMMHAI